MLRIMLLLFLLWATGAQALKISPHELPAQGEQESLLQVERFGYYNLWLKSPRGSTLQIIDRVEGPGEIRGKIDKEDGRLDLFLERGEYRLVIRSSKEGKGKVRLYARRSQDTKELSNLEELDLKKGRLEDRSQRSWSLTIHQAKQSYLEAAGRHLQDLRLWTEDGWLIEAQPRCELHTPRVGRPLRLCRLSSYLQPGRYLLTAYGGPEAQPWSLESDERPLYLRRGIPKLGTAGRHQLKISPFGIDLWESPGVPYYRVDLPEVAPFSLEVARWLSRAPWGVGYLRRFQIQKKSRQAFAEIYMSGNSSRLLRIKGQPGQPYLLQYFRPQTDAGHTIYERGEYFLSTLVAGPIKERPWLTGYLLKEDSKGRMEIQHENTLSLGAGRLWERRHFNLEGPVLLLLRVEEHGIYRAEMKEADLSLRPLILQEGGQEPEALAFNGISQELDIGHYALEIRPRNSKIVSDLKIQQEGVPSKLQGPVRPGLQIPKFYVNSKSYFLQSRLPGVEVGLVLRSLPIQLEQDPLPASLLPGESLELPIEIQHAGTIRVGSESGEVAFSLGGGSWAVNWKKSHKVEPGRHLIQLKNLGKQITYFQLSYHSKREGELPIQALRLLQEKQPLFADFKRRGSEMFEVKVDPSALYTLESSGLLATEGMLRTRVRARFAQAQENGAGRNFRVTGYLASGDYRVVVQARGRSQGRLGLSLKQAPVIKGGALRDGVPARIRLAAGEALSYYFDVDKPGGYRLRALGRGRGFSCRIEDERGWPLFRPAVQDCSDLQHHFKAGRYQLLMLPEAVETQHLTRLSRNKILPHFEGNGPHNLPLDVRLSHLWRESPVPQLFNFKLSGESPVFISLDDSMQAELWLKEERIGRLLPGHPWQGRLKAGSYQIRVRSARPDDRVRYSLLVRPRYLLAGMSRRSSWSDDLTISIAKEGLVELESFGKTDVLGRLFDDQGQLVASADDQPGDWNFRMSVMLKPGQYRLKISALGEERRPPMLSMRVPLQEQRESLKPGSKRLFKPNALLNIIPLQELPEGSLMVLKLKGAEALSLGLEIQEESIWRLVEEQMGATSELIFRPRPGAAYRLRLRSLEEQGSEVQLSLQSLKPSERLRGPGLFKLQGSGWACPEEGGACLHSEGLIAVGARGLWLQGEAKAKRLKLGEEGLSGVPVKSSGTVMDLAADKGPLLISAHSSTGQPLLSLEGGARTLRAGAALVLDPEGEQKRFKIYSGDASPLSVRLKLKRLQTAPPETLIAWGAREGSVPAGMLLKLILPGVSDLRLSLSPGLVALSGDRLLWAHGEASSEEVSKAQDALLLLNPGAKALSYHLRLLPSRGAGDLLEWSSPSAGARQVRIPEGAGLKLRGAGEIHSLSFIGDDQRSLHAQNQLDLSADGLLRVEYGPGPVLLWLEGPGQMDPWGDEDQPKLQIKGTDSVSLKGDLVKLQIEQPKERLMQLRVAAPCFVRAAPKGGPLHLQALPAGGGLDLWLPEGQAEISLRGVGGAPLWGEALFSFEQPRELKEGLGPQILLAPGESRAFSFKTLQDGPVGLGLQAEADRVEAKLLDWSGALLSEGAAQMPMLKEGRYLYLLQLPSKAAPVRVRPALAGIQLPDSTPPAQIRRYLKQAGYKKPGGQ